MDASVEILKIQRRVTALQNIFNDADQRKEDIDKAIHMKII